jgi:hypothetical protein
MFFRRSRIACQGVSASPARQLWQCRLPQPIPVVSSTHIGNTRVAISKVGVFQIKPTFHLWEEMPRYKHKADADHLYGVMRKAGLPE